jgi:hypothetical protein
MQKAKFGEYLIRNDRTSDLGRAFLSFSEDDADEPLDLRVKSGEVLRAFGVHFVDGVTNIKDRLDGTTAVVLHGGEAILVRRSGSNSLLRTVIEHEHEKIVKDDTHADTTNLAEGHFAFLQGRRNEIVFASKSDGDTAE